MMYSIYKYLHGTHFVTLNEEKTELRNKHFTFKNMIFLTFHFFLIKIYLKILKGLLHEKKPPENIR